MSWVVDWNFFFHNPAHPYQTFMMSQLALSSYIGFKPKQSDLISYQKLLPQFQQSIRRTKSELSSCIDLTLLVAGFNIIYVFFTLYHWNYQDLQVKMTFSSNYRLPNKFQNFWHFQKATIITWPSKPANSYSTYLACILSVSY